MFSERETQERWNAAETIWADMPAYTKQQLADLALYGIGLACYRLAEDAGIAPPDLSNKTIGECVTAIQAIESAAKREIARFLDTKGRFVGDEQSRAQFVALKVARDAANTLWVHLHSLPNKSETWEWGVVCALFRIEFARAPWYDRLALFEWAGFSRNRTVAFA